MAHLSGLLSYPDSQIGNEGVRISEAPLYIRQGSFNYQSEILILIQSSTLPPKLPVLVTACINKLINYNGLFHSLLWIELSMYVGVKGLKNTYHTFTIDTHIKRVLTTLCAINDLVGQQQVGTTGRSSAVQLAHIF